MDYTSSKSGSVVDPLVENIRRGIKAGTLVAGGRIGSEYQLATKAGISRGTVRRAIGKLVGEGLVERRPGKGVFVREKHTKTRSLCFMVANLAFSHWALLAQAVQKYGREKGLAISVYDIHVEIDKDLDIIDNLPVEEFNGAIISFLADRRVFEAIYKMRSQQVPFAVIGGNMFDPDVMLVGNDNFGDGRQIGEKLIAMGHRRIGYLGVPDVISRYHGLRAAMDVAGLQFDPKLAIDMGQLKIGADWLPAISLAVEKLLSLKEPPTAIFAGDDCLSAHVFRILRRHGISIPKDMSVVGFGGESFARLLDPPLSTIALPLEQTAKLAVDMVIRRMMDLNCPGEHKFMLSTWIDGESVGPPRD